MIKTIKHNDKILAMIIPASYQKNGVEFFTPNDFSQQLAYMKHPQGRKIDAHIHNRVSREVFFTNEVLIIRQGKLRVDFYDNDRLYINSEIIGAGDVILLASGGHGFECLEEVEMIEVKQGPYLETNDKVRFEHVKAEEIVIND